MKVSHSCCSSLLLHLATHTLSLCIQLTASCQWAFSSMQLVTSIHSEQVWPHEGKSPVAPHICMQLNLSCHSVFPSLLPPSYAFSSMPFVAAYVLSFLTFPYSFPFAFTMHFVAAYVLSFLTLPYIFPYAVQLPHSVIFDLPGELV